jgi:hypothetical protein
MQTMQMHCHADDNRKLFSKCRADHAQRHGDETENCFQNEVQMHMMTTENCFQNAEQMHRDMEMKTENCFQNEEQMHSLGPWKNSMQMQPPSSAHTG